MKEYIILFVVFIIIAYLNYNVKKKTIKNDKLCVKLYNGNNKQYSVIKNVLTPKFCEQFIANGEKYAEIRSWLTERHDNYPTTDNEVTNTWTEYKTLENLVKGQIGDEIARLYKINKKHVVINEFFIVKYDIHGQKHLRYHEDGSEFSFVIGLNDDYEGGGTKFKSSGNTVRLNVGECLIFSGQHRHKGNSVTKGTRYIVAGFLSYKGKEYCKNSLNT